MGISAYDLERLDYDPALLFCFRKSGRCSIRLAGAAASYFGGGSGLAKIQGCAAAYSNLARILVE
jgi:hypothetical protein